MRNFLLVPAAVLVMLLTGCQGSKQNPRDLKTQADSVSYIIGIDVGRNLKAQKLDLSPDVIAEGIRDAMADSSKPMITDETGRKVFMEYQKIMAERLSEKNKKEGAAFLEENKKKEGVMVLPSGLQYRVITAGSGAKPGKTDSVLVHYRAMTIDRKEIGSSYAAGGPKRWYVSSLLPGLTEAILQMPVGSKWEIFVPSDLAYGDRPGPTGVGGNLVLIFEIELLAKK